MAQFSLRVAGGATAALVTLCLAGSALAEPEQAPPPGEQTGTAPAQDPEAASRERAQQLFLAAMTEFDAERYADALEKFRGSYDVVQSPNSLLMAARCLRALGRMPEAFAEYDMALVQAEAAASSDEKYIETVQATRDELRDVRSQVALVMVVIEGEAPEDARLTVGGREVPRSMWKRAVPAAPGTVQVLLEGKGIERQEMTLDLNGGEEGEVEFEVEHTGAGGPSAREAAQKQQLRKVSYIAGGVAGASLLTFGIVALADGSDGLKYTMLGIGGVSLVGGVVLYALSIPSTPESGHAALVVGPTSLGVVGSF